MATDPEESRQMGELILLRGHYTFILVEHDMDAVRSPPGLGAGGGQRHRQRHGR